MELKIVCTLLRLILSRPEVTNLNMIGGELQCVCAGRQARTGYEKYKNIVLCLKL